MAAMIEPFTLAVPEAELEDLRARLRATRWPEPATDPHQGVTLERLQERCARWAEGYDWRAAERRLNAVPQFTTTIDGLTIHFLHARSPRPDAFPLVLTHGWPGSVVEFLDVLPLLTEAGFHCVVPSLPGYGWSGKPTEPGWGVARIARAWAALMARLGYARYGAQGTDWGTSVSASLGQQDREHVAGIHLMPPLAPTTAAARQADDDAGYSTQHRTRPQTIGYALTDSPAGLAAWIGEKLDSWTDPRTPIPEDRILDTLMLYWLPRTAAPRRGCTGKASATSPAGSKGRSSQTTASTRQPAARSSRTSCSARPATRPPRASPTSATGASPSSGGHFPALEQPETFAAEVAAFFALVR